MVEKLEGIIHSRQMKKDIRKLSPQLQTANLEAYHSLINHEQVFLPRDAGSVRINTPYYYNALKLCFKLWHYD